MTVASINSTVSVVVASELGMDAQSSYAAPIAKVSEALEAREHDIVDAIVAAAQERYYSYDVSKEDIEAIVAEAGLSVRPAPAPVVEESAPEQDEEAVTADDVAQGKLSKGQRLAKLEESQAAILSALQSLGQTTAALKTLAERHLGASL